MYMYNKIWNKLRSLDGDNNMFTEFRKWTYFPIPGMPTHFSLLLLKGERERKRKLVVMTNSILFRADSLSINFDFNNNTTRLFSTLSKWIHLAAEFHSRLRVVTFFLSILSNGRRWAASTMSLRVVCWKYYSEELMGGLFIFQFT